MFARVTTFQAVPGKLDEMAVMVRDSVRPELGHQPGFVTSMTLTDHRTGKGMMLSLWETEAALAASETSGYFQEQMAKFGEIFVMPPFREVYEVSNEPSLVRWMQPQ